MMDIYIILTCFTVFLYAGLMIFLTLMWLKTPETTCFREYEFKTSVSVIIAARNEEDSIAICLLDILAQNYPIGLFEIIVVDDSSEDSTLKTVTDFHQTHPDKIKVIELRKINKDYIGKKAAINEAVKIATGKLIITTDADCRFGKNWLGSMVSFYESNNFKMLVGPVAFNSNKNLFEKLQSIEFMGLIGVTGAFCFAKKPIMCNGANFAYEKSLFEKLNTYSKNTKATGDDVFLLLDTKTNEGADVIGFVKSREAIVYTSPKKTISEFFMQRKRWASKASGYKDFEASSTSLLVFICNSIIALTLVLSIFSSKFVPLGITMILVKSIADFLFLYTAADFFNMRKYFWIFLPEQFFYIIYVVIVGVFSQFGKYKWKSRQTV